MIFLVVRADVEEPLGVTWPSPVGRHDVEDSTFLVVEQRHRACLAALSSPRLEQQHRAYRAFVANDTVGAAKSLE